MSKKNIFVEGIPGTGKSTLLNKLQKEIIDYQFYWEGDISPVELAWCSYLTEKEYAKVLSNWPELSAEIQEFSKREDNHSPYGKNHPFIEVKDVIAHFTKRIRLEKRIMDQLFPNNYIELESKQYDVKDVVEEICAP